MGITRYLYRTYIQIQSCVTPQDKALILVNRAIYPFIHYARKITKRRLTRDYPLLLWNIRYHTKDGIFLCRKFTDDFELLSPTYEASLRPFFSIHEGVFVDVGAHVGKYTIMVGKLLGNKGKVIAIEPHPDNYQALLRHISLNGLQNVIAVQKACTPQPSEVSLYKNIDDGRWSIKYNFGLGKIVVYGEPLDSILKSLDIGEVNLLKIDVEGAEMDVLQGAVQVLARSPRLVVVMEAWPENAKDAIHFLQHRGFKVLDTSEPNYFVATKG